VVVLLNIGSEDEVTVVADKLLERLSREYEIGHVSVKVTASIGICIFPWDGITVDTLLITADKAMYQAKQLGKNRYCVSRYVKKEHAE
jgi:diguanylate cyclase (GGDEF)-like protein